jgi:hypothetical protein
VGVFCVRESVLTCGVRWVCVTPYPLHETGVGVH